MGRALALRALWSTRHSAALRLLRAGVPGRRRAHGTRPRRGALVTLTFDEARHVYRLDGQVLPGVTSVLNVIHKPELMAWVGRLGTVESNRQRDAAANHGIWVHAACEAVARGECVDDPVLLPYVEPYSSWLNANVHRVLAAEPQVASRTHGVAGSIDLVAEMIDGQNAIIDLKTGSTVPDTTPIQTSAYGRLLLEQDGVETTRRIAIHLPRKSPGELTVIEYPAETEPEDWRVFLCCLILYRRFMVKNPRPAGRPARAGRNGGGL